MQKRRLGKSDLAFAPIVFGGNVFGWTVDEARGHQLLDAFVDKGFSFIDTADVYSFWVPGNRGGESEIVIGNWLNNNQIKRNMIHLATKCGMPMPSDGDGLSRTHILKSVDASLKRLRTDYIDLYQAHKDDPETPQEETMAAFDELVRAGKVRVIGASNFEASRLEEANRIAKEMGVTRFESLQPHYNLADRGSFEGALEDECIKQSIGVIPYFALASGFLSGKYRKPADLKNSSRGDRVKMYMNDVGMKVLHALDQAALRTGFTHTQISLAWLLQRPSVTAPIVSATSLKQLDEILHAATIVLDEEIIQALNSASAVPSQI